MSGNQRVLNLGTMMAFAGHVTYGDVVLPPGSTYGPIVQPSIEIGFVHTGSMSARLDGERIEVLAGEACLVLPGSRADYLFSPVERTHHSWLHLWSGTNYGPDVVDVLARLPRKIAISAQLANGLQELLELGRSRLPTRTELELLCGHRMLYQFIGEARLAGERAPYPLSPVDRALAFVDDHLALPIGLEDIAQAASVSPSHLIRLFHARVGSTPGAYLWRRRLERGVALLENTGLTVAEIAAACGFRTSHHFSRRVRRHTGLAPTDIRRFAATRGVVRRSPVPSRYNTRPEGTK